MTLSDITGEFGILSAQLAEVQLKVHVDPWK